MSDTLPIEPAKPRHSLTYYGLLASTALVAMACLIGFGVATAELAMGEGSVKASQIIAVVALLVGGLAAGAALFALATTLRLVYQMQQAIDKIEVSTARCADETQQLTRIINPGITSAQGEAMQRALEDIRDNVLMPDEERRTKRLQMIAMERRQRIAQIQQAVSAGLYHRARTLVQELEQRLGVDAETRELTAYVNRTAAEAEAHDIATASKQCEDLMSLTSWETALKIASDLVERHPNSEVAQQLLERVQREKELHEQQHRARLLKEVERAIADRQWRRALVASRELMGAYPGTPEAQSLLAQRETLEANAQIEHRRELEARYKEFCETKRYADALALARQVINEYPNSPQAQVMRTQIPQLEKQLKAQL